jgi:hypothetical protein
MAGIILGPEKLAVAEFKMRATDDRSWWFRFPYRHYEVEALVAGDERGPIPEWLDLAARVGAQLEKPVLEAKSYLRFFMGAPQGGRHGDWSLEWLEFGQEVHAGLQWPFELIFVQEGDTYGGWGVLFADAGMPIGYWPRQFRRFER